MSRSLDRARASLDHMRAVDYSYNVILRGPDGKKTVVIEAPDDFSARKKALAENSDCTLVSVSNATLGSGGRLV